MPDHQGIYAAAITPRRLGTQDINLGVVWEILDFLSAQKVHGIVLLGAAGEFVHYGNAERMRVMGLAPKRSKIPVLINVSHSTLDGAVELGQAALASGARGVLLMPPYFYRYTQEEVQTFFRRFAGEADLNIPVLLYDLPECGNVVETATSALLLEEGVIQGIVEGSGSEEHAAQLQHLRNAREFPLLCARDSAAARAQEAPYNGMVSDVAGAVPELLVSLRRAIQSDASDVAARLETRLRQFLDWSARLPLAVAIREALCQRGLNAGPHALPLSREQERTVGEFKEWFKPWLAAVQSESKHV